MVYNVGTPNSSVFCFLYSQVKVGEFSPLALHSVLMLESSTEMSKRRLNQSSRDQVLFLCHEKEFMDKTNIKQESIGLLKQKYTFRREVQTNLVIDHEIMSG